VTSSRPRPPYVTDEAIRDFVAAALREDVGEGDFSSIASIDANKEATARLLIKDNGIIAGVELVEIIFSQYDPRLVVTRGPRDGDNVQKGEQGLTVRGPARSILATERVVLNCLQRMSGIATYTNKLIQLVKGTRAQVTDTRKTTPGFRLCEKWAVYIGGGRNHRYALYDMIMLKDNHVDLGGGITMALGNARRFSAGREKSLQVEVETRTIDEVKEVLGAGGADVIMLDNMGPATIREAVTLIAGRSRVEASGNITEANIREVAECGVDYISIGALTHSVKSLDISLKVVKEP
jgi:nicotinate-nucleotide pyrophosphorylase (carboxylating)